MKQSAGTLLFRRSPDGSRGAARSPVGQLQPPGAVEHSQGTARTSTNRWKRRPDARRSKKPACKLARWCRWARWCIAKAANKSTPLPAPRPTRRAQVASWEIDRAEFLPLAEARQRIPSRSGRTARPAGRLAKDARAGRMTALPAGGQRTHRAVSEGRESSIRRRRPARRPRSSAC